MSILVVVALVGGLAALAFGLYLAGLLASIRRRGFGKGRRLELSAMEIALRYPDWWRLEEEAGPEDARRDLAARAGAVSSVQRRGTGGAKGKQFDTDTIAGDAGGVEKKEFETTTVVSRGDEGKDSGSATAVSGGTGGPEVETATLASGRVRLVTGHHRGVLTIEPGPRGEESGSHDPEQALRGVLRTKGYILDEVKISRGLAGQQAGGPGVRWSRVSVSSAGTEESAPDRRTYFELHLVSMVSMGVSDAAPSTAASGGSSIGDWVLGPIAQSGTPMESSDAASGGPWVGTPTGTSGGPSIKVLGEPGASDRPSMEAARGPVETSGALSGGPSIGASIGTSGGSSIGASGGGVIEAGGGPIEAGGGPIEAGGGPIEAGGGLIEASGAALGGPSSGERSVLFIYTNSVLQGFLDVYYLEKLLETLEPLDGGQPDRPNPDHPPWPDPPDRPDQPRPDGPDPPDRPEQSTNRASRAE